MSCAKRRERNGVEPLTEAERVFAGIKHYARNAKKPTKGQVAYRLKCR